MDILTQEKLLAVQNRKFELVDVPELGGSVRLGSPTAATVIEIRQLERRRAKGEDVEKDLTLLLISSTVVDGVGRAVFDKETAAAFLDRISPDTMAKLVEESTRMMKGATQGQAPASPSVASPSASSPTGSV
jgi:hypothetical protein